MLSWKLYNKGGSIQNIVLIKKKIFELSIVCNNAYIYKNYFFPLFILEISFRYYLQGTGLSIPLLLSYFIFPATPCILLMGLKPREIKYFTKNHLAIVWLSKDMKPGLLTNHHSKIHFQGRQFSRKWWGYRINKYDEEKYKAV